MNARVVAWLPQSPPSLPLHHLVPSRLLSPAWALSPGSQHRDLGQNDLPSSYHDNCPQSLDDCTSIQSKLENPSAQCAAECRLNPPAVDIVGECECTAPAPLPLPPAVSCSLTYPGLMDPCMCAVLCCAVLCCAVLGGGGGGYFPRGSGGPAPLGWIHTASTRLEK